MSIETNFRSALAGYAPLTSLVGQRIAKHAVEQGVALPIVVFSVVHEPQPAMAGNSLGELATFTVECWAATAVAAAAVGDQVVAALAAYAAVNPNSIPTVLTRAGTYDGELKLDGDVITVEWWAV